MFILIRKDGTCLVKFRTENRLLFRLVCDGKDSLVLQQVAEEVLETDVLKRFAASVQENINSALLIKQ